LESQPLGLRGTGDLASGEKAYRQKRLDPPSFQLKIMASISVIFRARVVLLALALKTGLSFNQGLLAWAIVG
jgi:hypothetical protein